MRKIVVMMAVVLALLSLLTATALGADNSPIRPTAITFKA